MFYISFKAEITYTCRDRIKNNINKIIYICHNHCIITILAGIHKTDER